MLNGSQCILKLSFDVLPSHDLLVQCLLHPIQLVGPALVLVFAILDDDLHLTVADKPPVTTMRRAWGR